MKDLAPSDDTRAQAIKILNDLSEGKRLVGIISHVTELKAQIEPNWWLPKGKREVGLGGRYRKEGFQTHSRYVDVYLHMEFIGYYITSLLFYNI